MNGKPFLDGGKGKVFQFSTNVSVARELNPGPWQHLTTIRWKSDGGRELNPGPSTIAADALPLSYRITPRYMSV